MISKYPLFFKDLLKHVSADNKASGKLHKRLTRLKAVVEQVSLDVNDKVASIEAGVALLAVYQRLQPHPAFSEARFRELVDEPQRRYVTLRVTDG